MSRALVEAGKSLNSAMDNNKIPLFVLFADFTLSLTLKF